MQRGWSAANPTNERSKMGASGSHKRGVTKMVKKWLRCHALKHRSLKGFYAITPFPRAFAPGVIRTHNLLIRSQILYHSGMRHAGDGIGRT
jgi:hypothetical protein